MEDETTKRPKRDRDSRRFPVWWIRTKLVGHDAAFFIGICGKTRQPFTLTNDPLTISCVGDLFADDVRGTCEEGQRCLNTACPLNRTTVASYTRAMAWPRPPAWFTSVKPIPMDDALARVIERLARERADGHTVVWRD